MDQPRLTWVISMKKWIPQTWWKLYQSSWPMGGLRMSESVGPRWERPRSSFSCRIIFPLVRSFLCVGSEFRLIQLLFHIIIISFQTYLIGKFIRRLISEQRPNLTDARIIECDPGQNAKGPLALWRPFLMKPCTRIDHWSKKAHQDLKL